MVRTIVTAHFEVRSMCLSSTLYYAEGEDKINGYMRVR